MSANVARSHSNQTNRARHKDGSERKPVFKSVVGNPFHVSWPSVPVNVQNSILAAMMNILEGVSVYYLSREQSRKKKKRSLLTQGDRVTKKDNAASTEVDSTHSIDKPQPPPILSSMAIGINEVTRRLESISRSHRSTLRAKGKEILPEPTDIPSSHSQIVLACRADIDPPLLIAHLPNLVAACNSTRRPSDPNAEGPQGTWLVTMSKGSEGILAEAMGLRRVSVLLLESSAPQFSAVWSLLQNIPLLTAPWLSVPTLADPLRLVPTHIKQLRTSAPKDMKAAKERRSEERRGVKERGRRSKSTTADKAGRRAIVRHLVEESG
ncbi:uncharacterized protein BXZ73DRAFT_39108 [Epithele typhae]|uniref:uncharacterized protein n=1 Tax=Epithele typhae TaxID=378194 RepID=UPI0020076D58|nr:uncharacterized protein BXZ73DRAFT_39108 [Epithele typhae]KAH9944163.1 hypothetical protein BXZ73DRAFT_39108 [Epithele typhae]